MVAVLVAIGPFRAVSQEAPKTSAEYVDSRLCANCHPKIYETYQRTGMARSFYRPSPAAIVEDYRANNSYYHPASDTHFQMIERDGKYYQRRYQIDFEGKQTNIDEKQIDYVLGSGNHVRTYLHRTSTGALLQLPLAWYAEKGGLWAMSPGYDKPDQPGSRRKIYFECLFCHNSYPHIAVGHDQPEAQPLFTGALPEGIDCQRCHGPGSLHVRLAQAGAGVRAISDSIVNPARLTPDRQIEVCMQCHLETDSMPLPHSIVKFDRGPFSYRPGEPLANFILFFDRAPANPAEDRFQIVNSVYRLKMSACFLKSAGAMQCTTCHDPHSVPRVADAARTYNAACLKCHATAFRQTVDKGRHTASTDCIGCHMPKRRTSDVVHAVMTDHYIQRRKPDRDLLAEMPEPHGPETVYHGEVLPYYPKPLDATPENKLYLALAQVREDNNSASGLERFASAISKYQPTEPQFYVELGDAWVRHGQPQKAAPLFEQALRRKPDSLAALLGLARALDLMRRRTEAAEALQRATKVLPDDPVPWRELAEIHVKQGNPADALAALETSLKLDPEAPESHYAMGLAWSQPGDPSRSETYFREAIRLAPDYSEAHMNLAILLFQKKRAEEARYQFESALRYRPDYALGHLNYGLMLLKLNRTDEAKQHLQRAAAGADPSIRQSALKLISEIGN